jgi:hypothetical protein
MSSLRKWNTVGVTWASGVDPAGTLAAFTSCSDAFDNCGLLPVVTSAPSYSMTTGNAMIIHVCNNFSQAQSLTRCVYLQIGQTARRAGTGGRRGSPGLGGADALASGMVTGAYSVGQAARPENTASLLAHFVAPGADIHGKVCATRDIPHFSRAP